MNLDDTDATSAGPSITDSTWNLMTGTATRYILLAVNVAIGAVLMPFTVRHLGTAEYGLWMLVASMTYYLQLLDLGYGSGLVRQLSEADARHDITLANQVLSTFVVVYSVVGLVALAGVGVLMFVALPRFPNLTAEQVASAQVILAWFGIRIAIGFPMAVFGATTVARQRFAPNNLVAIVVALLNGLLTWVVLSAGGGLLTLVGVTTTLSLASYGAYVWTARRAFPEMRIRPSSFSRALVRDVTAFSVYAFLLDIAIQIGMNLDNVVIGAALGTSAVAVYSVALRLADYQRQLCNQFNGLLFPVVVRFGTAGDSRALRGTLVDGTRIALTLITGVTVCVVAFGSPLIEHWMGAGFEGAAAPLYVLAITGVVLVGQGPLGSILFGTGRHRLVALSSLGEALVNLALSLVLVRRFGMLGVALGTCIPVAAANLFILLPAACRQVGLGVREFARMVVGPPIAGVLPAAVAAFALRRSLPPESFSAVIAEGAAVGVLYLASACAFGLDEPARARYADHAKRLLDGFWLRVMHAVQV